MDKRIILVVCAVLHGGAIMAAYLLFGSLPSPGISRQVELSSGRTVEVLSRLSLQGHKSVVTSEGESATFMVADQEIVVEPECVIWNRKTITTLNANAKSISRSIDSISLAISQDGTEVFKEKIKTLND